MPDGSQNSATSTANGSNANEQQNDLRQHSAVATLQRSYRNHRSKREAAGLNLETSNAHRKQRQGSNTADDRQQDASPITPKTRWDDAMATGGLMAAGKEQQKGLNDPTSRWQRTSFYAARISGGGQSKDEGADKSSTAHEKVAAIAPNKQMEAQYWLEMVDIKHRYGTNLKSYHDAWNKSDTTQNFFYWLDEGDGKELNLDDCPREQLDKERVTYLNAEQRKNYLVDIGSDGQLYWHRNGRKVDTAKGKWEDLGNGRGIGYKGEKDNLPPPPAPHEEFSSSSSSSSESSLYSSSDSEAGQEELEASGKAHHYRAKSDKGEESTRKYLTSRKAVMDLLLRKTINSNTWIFVMTTKHQLYVGIKSTGGFQHSSFMYGATVAAAGLLKVKEGQLTSLSPLSGHYRAGTMHFKAFCQALEDKGVDMSKVSISKSLVVIGGVEKYGKFSKKKKSAKEKIREKLHLPPNKEQRQAEERERRDKSIERNAQIDARGKTKDPAKKTAPSSGEEEEHESIEANLHEGKKPEHMTDQQRAERAVALIQSAMQKGLKGERRKIEQDAEKEDRQERQSVSADKQE